MAMLPLTAWAHPVATPTPSNNNPAVAETTGAWSSLSKAQQQALKPLKEAWGGLSEGQKRKWLAIAKTYPSLGAADQEKLHSRMVEWAGLSPRDRELARLNFAQTKSLAKEDRAADWKAYQALSPEDAAVAIKPVAPDKMATVPVTRHTPETERAAAAKQKPLNRNTLLPQNAEPAPAAESEPTPPKP